MQQLLGDHIGRPIENAFLKELFLQCHPSNVRMTSASANTTTHLAKLEDMADQIIEVVTPPTVDATSTSNTVARLTDLLASITHCLQRGHSCLKGRHPISPLLRVLTHRPPNRKKLVKLP